MLDIIMVIWELGSRFDHLLASTPRLAKQVEENKALRFGNRKGTAFEVVKYLWVNGEDNPKRIHGKGIFAYIWLICMGKCR